MYKKKLKYILILISISLIVVLVSHHNITKTLDLFLEKTIQSLPKPIKFPNEYKNLFNEITQTKIKHIHSDNYNNKKTYPVSNINIYGMDGLITKFDITKEFSTSMKTINNFTPTTIWYENYSSKYLTIYLKRPQKTINKIIILSTQKIDTVLNKNKFIIIKGILKKVGISLVDTTTKLDKFDKPKLFNLYVEDERPFSYLKKDIKFYMILKRVNGKMYFIFFETKKFDDKKILSLFKR